jgi:hypothetical protein
MGLKQRMLPKPAHDLVSGARVLPLGHGCHPLSIRWVTTYGHLDDPFGRLNLSIDQSKIGLLDLSIPELVLEGFQNGLALGDHERS